ncbi:MAG: RdgB/HAM1 family non-canonical purine NTP pyrophosphatase [Proteobacteria bacterium]|nr:MAG: RdgB/HAM1 family non-canonical purine NTP pyrophosphatase [Pseudomonadota bacterium]
MRKTDAIVFASMNGHKLLEMRALFAKFPEYEILSPSGLLRNASKIGAVETYSSYADNSAAKARLVNQGCHYPTIADDSGLEVSALDQRPGVHSHRYADLSGYPSAQAQDQANVTKLLGELTGQTNRQAEFVCHLSLVVEGVLVSAEGRLRGTIANVPSGQNGFGYDPVFVPHGETRTFAEMTETEKNKISHRAVALEALMQKVKELGIQIAKP